MKFEQCSQWRLTPCELTTPARLTSAGARGAVLDYNATFINDFGVALLNFLAGSDKAGAGNGGTFVSPVSVMLALALLLNGASPGSSTFWCAAADPHYTNDTGSTPTHLTSRALSEFADSGLHLVASLCGF